MEKSVFTVCIILVLAISCSLAAFAGYRGHIVSWDEPGTLDTDGKSVILGKSLNDGGIANEQNQIRRSWTASRAMPQENATFVELENGASDGVCVKLINTEYMTNDPEADGKLVELAFVSLDMRCDKVGKFCGIVVDFENEEGFNNSGYADFEATNDTFILSTGYGFSVLENNKIRAFINAEGEKPTYYDFDLPFDSKTAFHNYALYRDADVEITYLTVDGKYIASFDFSGESAKMGIYDANGKPVAIGADYMFADGNIWFAVVDECEVYIDNVVYDAYDEESAPQPLKTESDPAASEDPAATEEPKATEAPAATEEAKATEAPKATEEPKEKSGCGSFVSGGAAVLAAACVLVLKKKEN